MPDSWSSRSSRSVSKYECRKVFGGLTLHSVCALFPKVTFDEDNIAVRSLAKYLRSFLSSYIRRRKEKNMFLWSTSLSNVGS